MGWRWEAGRDFVSPAGRVRGRRRAATSAFVVAAAGRLGAEGVAGTGPGRLSTNPHKFARILFVFVRFMLIRGQSIGASRGHETARGAVHESPRARDAKAVGPLVETRKRFAPRSNGWSMWEGVRRK